MARLTIPNEVTSVSFTVTTPTTAFPISFALFDKADLIVTVDEFELDQSGFTFSGTLLDGGGYQGGTVTLNTSVDDVTVLIRRVVNPQRSTNFAPSGAVPVGSVDMAFNRVTASQQDLLRETRRIQLQGLTAGLDASGAREAIGLTYASAAEAKAGTVADKTMTPLRAWGAMRTLVEWINPREPRFAGGAPMNGVDDDAPAFRAALAYAKTLSGNVYDGGSIKIKAPRGIVKLATADPSFSDRALNATSAHNILIDGEGDGCTTIKTLGNFAAVKATDNLASPLFRFGMRDLTLYGPGYTNTAAHGIDLAPNNNCDFANVRIWGHRRGITAENSFHTEYRNIRMNGTGGLACYDGFYLRDGDASVVENAVGIYGGRVYGCVRYGFRGESVTGSYVNGLEVLGCGLIGVYLGDSPTGKPLKWFTWNGGLLDTCPDLLVAKKGSSPVAELLHWSGLWMGYASEGAPGFGVGVEFTGIRDSKIDADIMVNMSTMAQIDNCDGVRLNVGPIKDYDRTLVGAAAILLQNSSGCRIDIGSTRKAAGSPGATAYVETGTSNHNLITGIFDGAVTTAGAGSNKTTTVIR